MPLDPRLNGTAPPPSSFAAQPVVVGGCAALLLNDALIRHPQGTFVMRASGSEMHDAGIDDGDVILVDRVLTPARGNIVVAVVEGEFLCRRLWKRDGVTRLQVAAADPDHEPGDRRTSADPIEIWGVVTTAIKSLLG